MRLRCRPARWLLAATAVAAARGAQSSALRFGGDLMHGLVQLLSGLSGETNSSEPEPLHVIGAGLGRTGTLTLNDALRRLNYTTMHMEQVMKEPLFWVDKFARAAEGDPAPLVRGLASRGFNATLDFPACLLYRELMAAYPHARVVLTVRSSAQVWADSVMPTILEMGRILVEEVPFRWIAPARAARVARHVWSLSDKPMRELTREDLIAMYDKHVAAVLAAVPPERLLVFDVREGWAPLCRFLHVRDCPTGALPRSNDTAQLLLLVRFLHAVTWLWPLAPAAAMLGLVHCCRGGPRRSKEKRL
jgi:hypothetical protein